MNIFENIRDLILKIFNKNSNSRFLQYHHIGDSRLYYSNDGLMFFSPNHGKGIFYFVDKGENNE